MRREECKGGGNKPFCGTGTSAVKAGVPEGKAPTVSNETKAEPKDAPDQDAKVSSEIQPANPVKSKSAGSRRSRSFLEGSICSFRAA